MFKKASSILILFIVVACASNPELLIDPASITSQAQLDLDRQACIDIANGLDSTDEVLAKSVGGAAIGAAAVGGVATAVAGAIFAPAIPFIIAGGAAGGGLWGSAASREEKEGKLRVMEQCMSDRGYRVYSPNL